MKDATRLEDEIRRYQTDVLGAARDRLTDEKNPVALDDLDGVQHGFESVMPDLVKNELPSSKGSVAPNVLDVSLPPAPR